ncbi:PD-(D/E)XK nuclease family protein [Aquabacterium sp.]|uniref:PD-(D/E)XK nuclease family protein n=1 Tax=Aquabacterium sp. TaxID=1872578 RepID=UPI003784E7F5
MDTIEQIHLPQRWQAAEVWRQLPVLALEWLRRRDLSVRDAVLLLPSADLLPPARQAFALQGGWQPRIETPRTLADSLGPAPEVPAGAPTGDVAIDRLLATALLAPLSGVADWRRRDPAAFEQAIGDLVQAAHALKRAAQAQPPAARSDWWRAARRVVEGHAGPAPMAQGLSGDLARLALAWAAMAGDPATDRLFGWRASAWMQLCAGGDDVLGSAVLRNAAQAGMPALRLVADAPDDAPFAAAPSPTLWRAAEAEEEALAAAGAVIQHLTEGRSPVALVAEDRLLVRRIRALLERARLHVADESGWTLSTTRAAAHLMAVLRAVRPSARPDAQLDGLKAEAAPEAADWIDALEAYWRRGQPADEARGARLQQALAQWEQTRDRWQAWATPPRRALAAWLQALRGLLLEAPSAGRWRADPAARAVWQALRLDSASARGDVDAMPLHLDDFIAWVDATLAAGSYIAAVDREAAQVVITPLARAILRPFGAVVVPGADERTLGPPPAAPSLLGDALLRALGQPDRETRALRGALAFAQLLREPQVLLLRRVAEGDEHLGPSPWIARLQLARHAQGLPLLEETSAPLHWRTLQPAPVFPPRPSAAGALPPAISASALEALRTCPYRFYARSVLRLFEAEELAQDPGKRDYGTLLHAALQRFHDQRVEGQSPAQEAARLIALADDVAAESGLDGPAMLPFRAGMGDFAARYLHWLLQRDAQGWSYLQGEVEARCAPPMLGGLQLQGRIDRIDRKGAERQLIDYKTGSQAGLKEKLREPLEDTQLAFYAAQVLSSDHPPDALVACYLGLDERDGIAELPHPDVAASAEALLQGLAGEWSRLQAGEPLQALGEGMACDFCEARGLCRRDHWAAMPEGTDQP